MELIASRLSVNQVKGETTSQITFDEDVNVPDSRPDIGRIILKKGEIDIDDVKVGDDYASLSGQLQFHVLYVADEEDRAICHLEGTLPIDETIRLSGVESGSKICLKWEIDDLSIHLMNSRKLNIQAIASFYVQVDDVAEIALPTEIRREENLSVREEDVCLLSMAVHSRDTVRIREEFSLASNKPNVQELLWQDLEVRGLDIRSETDHLSIKGELFAFLLYRSEEQDAPPQWTEYAMAFASEVPCEGCLPDMIPDITSNLVKTSLTVKPDGDGEERSIGVDAVLELDMRLYREENIRLLQDAYLSQYDLCLTRTPVRLQSLLVRNCAKCRVMERVPIRQEHGRILQICHSEGTVKVDRTAITDEGLQVEGVLAVRILYSTDDDELPFYAADMAVPFTCVVEAAGINVDSTYRLQADIEQLSTMMADSTDIEVKALLNLRAIVFRWEERDIICKAEKQELDMEQMRDLPGMVAYVVSQGDTMWDIAKKFHTTVEDVCQMNEREDETVRDGEVLVLVKNISI